MAGPHHLRRYMLHISTQAMSILESNRGGARAAAGVGGVYGGCCFVVVRLFC